MSSTAYDRYLQQAGGLAQAIGSMEGNLQQSWLQKYQTEADRENTKKTLDVGKAAFNVAQGEALIGQAVGLGTAGLAAIQGGKKVIGAVRKTYGKHYGKPEEGEEEQIAEGDEGEALDRVGQGGGVRDGEQRAAGGDRDAVPGRSGEMDEAGLAAEVDEAEPLLQAGASGASEQIETAGHGMLSSARARVGEVMGNAPTAVGGGEIEMMEGGDANRLRDLAQVRHGVDSGSGGAAARLRAAGAEDAAQAVEEGTIGGMGRAAEGEAGEAAEGAMSRLASGASSAMEAASGAVEGLAERSFVADLALQATPFLGEALDLGLLAYGVAQGVSQYQEGKEEQQAASADPVNPPVDFGRTNPSLNASVAIPVFDTTRNHNSGHISTF